MNSRKLINNLAKIYPKRFTNLKEDRIGLFASKLRNEINNIVVSLDTELDVLDIAIKNNADIVIVHHPLLYPSKRVALKNPLTKKVYDGLVAYHIPLYCIHTNFDNALNKGMNTIFAEKIGINNVRHAINDQFCLVGELDYEVSIYDLMQIIKSKLNLDYVLYQIGNHNKIMIKTVAFVLGGATKEWINAKAVNADVFISGDSKHHERRYMFWNDLNYIEVGHEVEEIIFIKTIESLINSIDPKIKVITNYSQDIMKKY